MLRCCVVSSQYVPVSSKKLEDTGSYSKVKAVYVVDMLSAVLNNFLELLM